MKPRTLPATALWALRTLGVGVLFVAGLGAKAAEASDLNCTINHVSESVDGSPMVDSDMSGSVTVKNFDTESSTYAVKVSAGKSENLTMTPVALSAGEAHSYAATSTQSVSGETLSLTYSLEVLTDQTFTFEIDTSGSDTFPSTTDAFTGTCN